MVIWDRKTLHPDMTKGEIPGTLYGLSSKGWIDQELFQVWFEFLLRYAPPVRPLFLLMDGHSSHFCPETIHLAAKSQVVLFTLPPNTTHLSQPLDRGCFGPLKAEWCRVCHEFMSANIGKVVTRYSFSELFSKAWMRAMTIKNILGGFRVTGIYPLDRSKLSALGEEDAKYRLSEATGLTFIPLLTPAPHRAQRHQDVPVFLDMEMHQKHEDNEMEN